MEKSPAPEELVRAQGEDEELYDPAAGSFIPVRDVREEIRRLSEGSPPSEAESLGFLRHRQSVLKSLQRVETEKGPSEAAEDHPPQIPPGGVGQGVMIRAGELEFRSSTGVYFYILAPAVLGGNTAPLLYLTSSNRAAKGCEALVSYQEQGEGVFRVWDWATPPQPPHGTHWVVGLPFGSWGDYRLTYQWHGIDHHALYVVNVTRREGGGDRWVNEVFLHNRRTGTRDRIWRYDFSWGGVERLDWGPIVETFHPDYGETSPVGFAQALFVQDGFQYGLSEGNSFIRQDNGGHGFQIILLDPNHSFLAR